MSPINPTDWPANGTYSCPSPARIAAINSGPSSPARSASSSVRPSHRARKGVRSMRSLPCHGVGPAPSLGTGTESVVSSEILTAARIALAHQRGLDHARHRQTTGTIAPKPSVSGKQALSWATVEGARALGLADRVGRIESGMQADLVVIDARALNLWPAHDPIAAALQADLANVEAVMIAGRWRKRDHALVDVDLDTVQAGCWNRANGFSAG